MRFQTIFLPLVALLGSTLATPVAVKDLSTDSKVFTPAFTAAIKTLALEAKAERKANPNGCGPICTAATCLKTLFVPGNAQKTCATTGLTPSEASTINMLQVKTKAALPAVGAGICGPGSFCYAFYCIISFLLGNIDSCGEFAPFD